MRKYLFRGMLTSGAGWAEGNLNVSKDGVYIITPDDTPIGKYGQVIPETVGQCSGVLDKNKTPMYEGDIVAGLLVHEIPINAVVVFQDGAFGLEWDKRFTAFTSICNVEYEVIGNIYDNPELWRG